VNGRKTFGFLCGGGFGVLWFFVFVEGSGGKMPKRVSTHSRGKEGDATYVSPVQKEEVNERGRENNSNPGQGAIWGERYIL